jgi:hypothetical protein
MTVRAVKCHVFQRRLTLLSSVLNARHRLAILGNWFIKPNLSRLVPRNV